MSGELAKLPPTCDEPVYAGDEISVSPRGHSRKAGVGRAVGEKRGFGLRPPHRDSFSPDVAFYVGPPLTTL